MGRDREMERISDAMIGSPKRYMRGMLFIA